MNYIFCLLIVLFVFPVMGSQSTIYVVTSPVNHEKVTEPCVLDFEIKEPGKVYTSSAISSCVLKDNDKKLVIKTGNIQDKSQTKIHCCDKDLIDLTVKLGKLYYNNKNSVIMLIIDDTKKNLNINDTISGGSPNSLDKARYFDLNLNSIKTILKEKSWGAAIVTWFNRIVYATGLGTICIFVFYLSSVYNVI